MSTSNVKTEIKTLNKEILAAQEGYYSGNPTMTDPEYDAKEARLSAMVTKNPQYSPIATALKKVGTAKLVGARIPHDRPMLSIENKYTEQDFIDAAKKYGNVLLIEPKRDGNSSELTYIDGVLTCAVSRGDGESGEDMTAQIKACKKIPQKINTKIHDLRIRGELVMRNSELARINSLSSKQYANTRNLVAGTLKQQDLSIVSSREIILIPWDMYSPDEDSKLPDSAYDRMLLTEKFGFIKYGGYQVFTKNMNDFWNTFRVLLKLNEVSDIISDGIVLKVDSHKLRNKLGVSSKFTNYQHCFKPQNLAAITTLRGIEFGLGRTGKVTPVALLEPVLLGGAQVARASVCNETYMENLGLRAGCKVKVLRSGDVIPYIVEVVGKPTGKKIAFPTTCPSCGTKLRLDPTAEIVQRFCDNSKCAGKAAEQFTYVANRETLEIDNLGESMAAELIDLRIATDLAELFTFANGVIQSKHNADWLKNNIGFRSGVNALKMVRSLEKAKVATWDRWFAALNIPMIGHSLGKDISLALNLTSADMKDLPKQLLKLQKLNLDKLGDVKTDSIIDWAKNPANMIFCTRLYQEGVRPTPITQAKKVKGAPLSGTVFCITGELSMGTRKEVEAKLEALGAEALSDVRSTCNLLIVGSAPGSKLQKAQKKGIKIVDENWVRTALGL